MLTGLTALWAAAAIGAVCLPGVGHPILTGD